MFNFPLVIAWLNTLNNDMLRQNLKSESDYDEERCWQTGEGLRVWNVAQQGIPKLNSDKLYADVDVVLITASSLQVDPIACWVTKLKWHTIFADEGHDYLRGQHNARPGQLSLTLQQLVQTSELHEINVYYHRHPICHKSVV